MGTSDVFFSNRRPRYIEKYDLGTPKSTWPVGPKAYFTASELRQTDTRNSPRHLDPIKRGKSQQIGEKQFALDD